MDELISKMSIPELIEANKRILEEIDILFQQMIVI